VGEDAKGNRYFYFSTNNEDCRLYCEGAPPPAAAAAAAAPKGGARGRARSASAGASSSSKAPPADAAAADGAEEGEERPWTTQTTSLEELQEFAAQFAGSRNAKERALYTMLQEQVGGGRVGGACGCCAVPGWCGC
jgi:hypothetical protein